MSHRPVHHSKFPTCTLFANLPLPATSNFATGPVVPIHTSQLKRTVSAFFLANIEDHIQISNILLEIHALYCPIARELIPLANVVFPIAVDASQLATVFTHIAVEAYSYANVLVPIAVE